MKTMLLIGGGPSECLVDYRALPPSWDTFAMNMAYQYFPDNNWYPTFFGCFDRRVCDYQTVVYQKMIDDKRCPIRHFYMVRDISESPRCTAVKLHGKTGDFSMDFDTFGYGGCTGANCAQVAACLGYKRIVLVGIDGYKTDVIEGAEQSGRKHQLKIIAPTDYNVNYSKSTYQPVGFEYNRPQNDKCHRTAWAGFAEFAEANGIEVINCSWGDVADCFPRATLPDTIATTYAGPLATFVMCLKGRSERALASIQSVVTPEAARHITFTVVEDRSNDMLDLSTFPDRYLINHVIVDTGETWNRSKLLNHGMKEATTEYCSAWDADFLFPPTFLSDYLTEIGRTDFDKEYLDIKVTEHVTQERGMRNDGIKWSGFYTHKTDNLREIGGLDEDFIGWGYEDKNLLDRVSKRFGLRRRVVSRAGFVLHHAHAEQRCGKGNQTSNKKLYEKHQALGTTVITHNKGILAPVSPLGCRKAGVMSVVLVGNGSGVLNGEYGEQVDSCDRIIRMNSFKIDGYEKHVGKRLDIYGCGKQYFKRSPEFLAQFSERWHPCLREKEPHPFVNPNTITKLWSPQIRTHFIEPATFRRLVKAAKRAEPDAWWGPSSGLRFINMVFDTWPLAQIYIIGFDHLSTGQYFNLNPRYLQKIREGSTHREAVTWERREINRYIKQGRVIRIDDV